MSSDNITPPQISPERIAQMLLELTRMPRQKEGPFEMFTIIVRAIEVERDRQWLERLEPVGWRIDWPDEPELGFQFEEDPVPAHLGRSVVLYRIKEQG